MAAAAMYLYNEKILLWGSLGILVLTLAMAWRRNYTSSGLPLSFLISLALIHLPGAWIAILPQSPSETPALVAAGFRECFVGITAFLAGTLLVELALHYSRKAGLLAPEKKTVKPTYSWAKTYVISGLICVGVLIPILRSVPSFGALANCGAYLIVAGFCLHCWQAWKTNNRNRFLFWGALTFAFPLFTMLTMGFIGYGAVAAMMVLVFALILYRPRWQASLAFIGLIYLGLSLYVTYMRDRNEIRDAVWGGEAYAARVRSIQQIFTHFEFFSVVSDQHLSAIDNRLNQNFLVGAAARNLDAGGIPFAQGKTVLDAMLAVIPRIIWPDKPVRAGSPEIVSKYTGITFEANTSIGVGQVLEFYINFGRWGVLIGFFSFGLIVRFIDWRAATKLAQGDQKGFVYWFLPGMAFLQTGGSLIEVFGTCAASFVLVIGVNKIVFPLFRPRSAGPSRSKDKRRAAALAGNGGQAVGPRGARSKAQLQQNTQTGAKRENRARHPGGSKTLLNPGCQPNSDPRDFL